MTRCPVAGSIQSEGGVAAHAPESARAGATIKLSRTMCAFMGPGPHGGLGIAPGRASVFPSGRNVFDLELILGLQLPDRVTHGGLILFGVGQGQVRAIN